MPSISVPTAAIIGASVVGAGAGIYGASQQAGAAKSAASAQEQAAQTASNTEQNMFNQASGYEQPFIQGGQQAYGTLNNLLGVNGNSQSIQDTLSSLPGYNFALNQGLEATQNGYAARGLGSSGGALRGAANYAEGLAGTNYSNYIAGLQNSANTGASAANALASGAVTTGGNIASNQIGAGNAAAAGSIAGGQAAANAANGISGAANSAAGLYTLNGLLSGNNANSLYHTYGTNNPSADQIINNYAGNW